MSFSHIDYFPFCIGERSPAAENARYNSIVFSELGYVGVGTIYPVGMTLRDAMTLYWKSRGISWSLYQSITKECFEFDEEGNLVPTGDSSLLEDYVTGYCPLKNTNEEGKPSSFEKRVCPEFEHRFTGVKTRYTFRCPPDDPPAGYTNPTITSDPYYPMSCFYVPLDFGGDPDPNLKVPYRILKSGDLYYPSLLLAFSTYSRLYITKTILAPNSGYAADEYKTVNLIINGNSYSISLLEVFNYTRDGTYDTQIGDEIYLDTWTP